MRAWIAITLLALLAAPASADPTGAENQFPEFDARDARAAPVTAANLLDSERFWPYRVELTRSAGGKPVLAIGSVGVLIRVESGDKARIDFGRDGIRSIPVADTDLVERANLVRRGELEKVAPNFVLAIGPRLVDSTAPELRPYSLRTTSEKRGFLCVFADPNARDFAELTKQLAPLAERHGVATILFPQARIADAAMREKLQSLSWPAAFVYDHLSEGYTRTLLPDGIRPPAVLLQTKEGRVLFQSAWTPDVAFEVSVALDHAFAANPAVSASADRN